jgi:hypothetical protein
MNTESLRRYTNLASALRCLREKKVTLLSPTTWDDKNDKILMEAFKRRKKLKTLLALCFAQAAETYHHWKVFAPGSDGVCLEFDMQLLIKALDHPNIRHAEVDYIRIDELRARPPILHELPFSKRVAYQDEDEYRFVYSSDASVLQTKDIAIPIACVNRIIVNPWIPKPLVQTIKETINAIDGFGQLKVIQSRVIDSPAWKRLADKYA